MWTVSKMFSYHWDNDYGFSNYYITSHHMEGLLLLLLYTLGCARTKFCKHLQSKYYRMNSFTFFSVACCWRNGKSKTSSYVYKY